MKITNICLQGAAAFALVLASTNGAQACHHDDDCASVAAYPAYQPQMPVAEGAPIQDAKGQMPIAAPAPKYGQAPSYGQAAPVDYPVAAPAPRPGFLAGVGGFLGFGGERNYRCKLEVNHSDYYVLVKAPSRRIAKAAALQAFAQQSGLGACSDAHVHCHD